MIGREGRRIGLLVVMLMVFSGPSFTRDCRGGDQELARFRAECSRNASEMQERYAHFRASFTFQEQIRLESKEVRTSEVDVAVDGNLKKATTHQPATSGQPKLDKVICIDDKATYQLEKKDREPSYLVRSVLPNEQGAGVFEGGMGRILKSIYCLGNRSLASRLADPDTIIKSAESVTVDGRELIRVELEFGKPPRTPAKILLDPAQGWAIRESEIRLAQMNNVRLAARVEYRTDHQDRLVPASIEYRDIDGKQKKCIFRSFSFDPTPREEFSPAFFHLPDLAAEPKKAGSSLGVAPWLAGIGLTGVVGAVALRRSASKRYTVAA